MRIAALVAVLSVVSHLVAAAEIPRELRIGYAGHAFDHFGGFGQQVEAAAASGATVIYASGLGALGYAGLPPENELATQCRAITDYNRNAKTQGIDLTIGYLCATSIVKLDTFDKNWSDEFRAQFKSKPADWRQQDRHGNLLPSWYGGDYQPACMNNPDWRAYQRTMVRRSLETGHNGIFFDNPTVHPQGCYCPHCMQRFAALLKQQGFKVPVAAGDGTDVEVARKLTDDYAQEFLRFRGTIATDFLRDMRTFARTINPNALVTCNNSLNSPSVLYSQCRNYGYNIHELSKVEDVVVVEDMRTQPRVELNGQAVEYTPTYKQLHAISHNKPIVAVTLVNDDYHTPPSLIRLAMAEAAANNASYLSWPTWPEDQRGRMIAAVRPQADFLRQNEKFLNDAPLRADVLLFLPFRRWLETDQCAASSLAAELSRANIQYEVVSEDNFYLLPRNRRKPVFVAESSAVLNRREQSNVTALERIGGHAVYADKPNWLDEVRRAMGTPSIQIGGPPTVRAIVRDQPGRVIVHLLNLDVARISSFEDKVTPAEDLKFEVTTTFEPQSVSVQTADAAGTTGPLQFTSAQQETTTVVSFTVPRLEINAIASIEKK